MNYTSVILSRVLQRLSIASSPIVRFLLSSRAHRLMSSQLLLLSFVGRKTGHSYKTPVSYVRDGNELLIPGGGRWWKNLDSGPVAVRLQGSWLPVSAAVIAERQAMSDALGRMMAASPAVSVFTGIQRGPDGLPEVQSLERALRRGFVVVRLLHKDASVNVNVTQSAVA